MPPRISPASSRGGRGGRGGPPGRGGGPAGGASSGVPSHVETIGVRRTRFGTAGRPMEVLTNHFAVSIPTEVISHYDVVISPSSEKSLPARLNMDLIKQLQTVVAPQLFTPRGAYDGRKNFFSAREIPFVDEGGKRTNTQQFDVTLSDPSDPPREGGRGPKVYKIKLNKVAEVNPEVLARFLEGKQSHDNTVLTAITALNVVVRMEPMLKYPFNIRSFFTETENKPIGGGLVLWRGYFQSVRPAVGRMLINIDISTGTMYQKGSLLSLCVDFLSPENQRIQPPALAPKRGFPDRQRLKLQRFLMGVRIVTINPDPSGRISKTPRVIKKVSSAGAADLQFQMREGERMSVAQYFQRTYNRPLQFPDLPCVEVGSGALLPLEVCEVLPGQIMRKQVPPEKTSKVLEFATMKPPERLASIRKGLGVLAYGQSDYVRQFGLNVKEEVVTVNARVLNPPTLRYSSKSREPTIIPRNGAWNMVDKKFYQSANIRAWVMVIYERRERFTDRDARELIGGLAQCCEDVGITGLSTDPLIKWENSQGRIGDQLRAAGSECRAKTNILPNLVVVILPDNGNDIYTNVKHFGDITTGVATQCMKSSKCRRARPQYFANVCLKINVKLGGINTIPDAKSVQALTDASVPTIVMGADVIHPAPGSDGRPSFTSLVANVDSASAKYIATSRVQTSRQEMIDDLKEMTEYMLRMYMTYRERVEKAPMKQPKRIIFYRDGVSEGQFKQVLEQELPLIREACKALRIEPMPTITIIVVGKRHHVRFFPKNPQQGDKSGNCPAGTVVDDTVAHPTEFDFYLQSHGGILGTSRPAHYSVLHDDNNFTPDALQTLSFALCHVYARSTRSVSIPAPVYYADIVCARAKNHYDPQGSVDFSDSATQLDDAQAGQSLDAYRSGFRPLHENMKTLMYFS